MTQILNVTRNDNGQYQIADQAGKLVDGPFETNAAAWRALDRLDQENANTPPKYRSGKKVLWGKPDRPKSKKATFDPAGERAYRDHKLGTFGAASEVRKIDVATYLAEKAARGEA